MLDEIEINYFSATNPSQFEIDFFVNDLSKRGAATFEQVGQFQYKQKGPINLEFDKKVLKYEHYSDNNDFYLLLMD